MPIITKVKPDVDTVVVGAGIIGATIAKALRKEGREVLLLDDKRKLSGTKPSGGHLKPSWFGGMSKTEYEPAMELLAETWGMHESAFKIWPTGLTTTVYRIDTDLVMKEVVETATVEAIKEVHTYPLIKLGINKFMRCKLLIVATGAWGTELFPQVSIAKKQGVSFRYEGKLTEEFIKPWAPFKQVVAHQQASNEIWVGDGSAILQKNWTPERTGACKSRCHKAIGTDKKLLRTYTGIRPYCDSGKDPCLLKQMGPHTWLVTGSGKSGTISAGWASRKIIDATN